MSTYHESIARKGKAAELTIALRVAGATVADLTDEVRASAEAAIGRKASAQTWDMVVVGLTMLEAAEAADPFEGL